MLSCAGLGAQCPQGLGHMSCRKVFNYRCNDSVCVPRANLQGWEVVCLIKGKQKIILCSVFMQVSRKWL